MRHAPILGSSRKLMLWVSDPEGEAGQMTLWPGTAREIAMRLPDFKTANALCQKIEAADYEAFERGRKSVFAQIENLR